jgi:hypothetical protein
MQQSNSATPRFTLKLKTAARKSPREAFSVAPGHSGSCPRPATASQTREPDSPSELSGESPSTPLPHPVANTPPPRLQSKLSQKPGSAWSDELKARMQEDMDALMLR